MKSHEELEGYTLNVPQKSAFHITSRAGTEDPLVPLITLIQCYHVFRNIWGSDFINSDLIFANAFPRKR